MSQPPPTQTAEQVIGGRYSYDTADVLGSGGLAVVYRGQDLKLRRPVAVKALRSEYLESAESRRRFRQEARMLRFAEHPGFAAIYDHVDQSNGSWIVMELVPGRTLKDVIEYGGPLSVEEVVHILNQLAGSLGHLHARGVVHLDLKPQNIVVTADNVPKLVDFGVAQPGEQAQERVDGHAFGTAAYLAPEQGKGERVDRRTDIYALGCVVYELLTGRPPFLVPDGPNQKQRLIEKHIGTVPAAPTTYRRDLAPWLDQVVLRAIAKSPGQRYQSAEEFADAAIAGLEQLPTRPPKDTTSRIPAEPAAGSEIDEDDDRTSRQSDRQMWTHAAWAAGGLAARRTRPIQRTIWRIAMAFAIGNLILLMALLYRHGGNAVLDPLFGSSLGTTGTVSTDWLNVREEPSVDADVYAILQQGVELTIAGMPRQVDDTWWWPVTVETEQGSIDGWVWEEGVSVSRLMRYVSAPSRVISQVGEWVETARDWLPFGVIGLDIQTFLPD